MRVRLYWASARLAHAEGREEIALTNVRKAIALLQATEDTLHLARAHLLAAYITLSRDDAERRSEHLDHAEHLLGSRRDRRICSRSKTQRSRVAALRGEQTDGSQPRARGTRAHPRRQPADAGPRVRRARRRSRPRRRFAGGGRRVSRAPSTCSSSRAAGATQPHAAAPGRTCSATSGATSEAMDALDRAAELGMRAAPDGTRIER